MYSPKFNNIDFQQFIQQKIKSGKNQKLCTKLRSLSKNHNSCFEEVKNSAVVIYDFLINLATSKFTQQIINLKLSVLDEMERVDELCFISTKYFENIQSVKLRFNDDKFLSDKEMVIAENLTIRGLTIENNQQVRQLKIRGKPDVNILNSKFNRIKIIADGNANVEISGVKFLNCVYNGFSGNDCNSIIMKDVFFKNCGTALNIQKCLNVVASNINVKNCVNIGFSFGRVENIQISNTKINQCFWGLYFDSSNGKMIDVILEEFRQYGVVLENSHVRYKRFLCVNNNDENGVKIRGDHSAFIQGG